MTYNFLSEFLTFFTYVECVDIKLYLQMKKQPLFSVYKINIFIWLKFKNVVKTELLTEDLPV